jgi:hypothetical protein
MPLSKTFKTPLPVTNSHSLIYKYCSSIKIGDVRHFLSISRDHGIHLLACFKYYFVIKYMEQVLRYTGPAVGGAGPMAVIC